MRESTGGKFAYNNNPFGWGSAKIKFSNFDDAIETVGKNLGGANSKTSSFYSTPSLRKKLWYYNGSVIKGYEDQVMGIMDTIDSTDSGKTTLADNS